MNPLLRRQCLDTLAVAPFAAGLTSTLTAAVLAFLYTATTAPHNPAPKPMQKTTRLPRLPSIAGFLLLLPFALALPLRAAGLDVGFATNRPSPEISFALTRLGEILTRQDTTLHIPPEFGEYDSRITLQSDRATNSTANDGYTITKDGSAYTIKAEHDRGAMYGMLDLAEQLGQGAAFDALEPRTVRAHHPFRAIKFNLPWYSYRAGENLSLHMETCREPEFWRAFLDMMAENKFNTLTLWNLHPFITMVRPKSFPEASGLTDVEFAEWQTFWHALFRMARERGIDTYVVNWNIFVSKEFAQHYGGADQTESAHFFGDGETSPEIEQYTRELVTQTIDEYPDLTGLGITLGERMGGMTSAQRRDWIDRTIIAGMRDANRRARLIYRAPLSADKGSGGSTSVTTEQLTREAIEGLGFGEPVWVEFKFNWSHAHSSPKLSIVHGGMLTDTYWEPLSSKYKAVWTMRNEDFFVLRWAQPDFIREFIRLNSQPYVGGAIIGSECYIPAKDYISKPGTPGMRYAFDRQWLFYKVWGNLLFDPTTPDSAFERALGARFGDANGGDLLEAWKLASMNANRFASFYQGTWDATIYTEGFATNVPKEPNRLIDIDRFIEQPVLDPAYLGIRAFVDGTATSSARIDPLALADLTEKESDEALSIVERVKARSPAPELVVELADVEAWSWHGKYFAAKLRGGVALARHRKSGDAALQALAVAQLTEALRCWKELVRCVEMWNRPVIPYQFDPDFSWRKQFALVEQDIAVAKKEFSPR